MITTSDVTLLKKTFATKSELQEFRQEMHGQHSEVMGVLSQVMTELHALREENQIIVYRQREQLDEIEELKKQDTLIKHHIGLV